MSRLARAAAMLPALEQILPEAYASRIDRHGIIDSLADLPSRGPLGNEARLRALAGELRAVRGIRRAVASR